MSTLDIFFRRCRTQICNPTLSNTQSPHTFFTQRHRNKATMASANGSSAKDFYEDEKHLMKLCDFLRSSEGPAVREAIEMDKRVYYIKGAWLDVLRIKQLLVPAGGWGLSFSGPMEEEELCLSTGIDHELINTAVMI